MSMYSSAPSPFNAASPKIFDFAVSDYTHQTQLQHMPRRNICQREHLKDGFFDWIKEMLLHSFVLNGGPASYGETFLYIQSLIDEHRATPERSRLKRIVPTVGTFFTPLYLHEAFRLYDSKYAVSSRRHVSPSFNEIRHTCNLAQVLAMRDLSFISFDGDQTLYSDGGNFPEDGFELADAIIALLRVGVTVAVITAAGYGYDGSRYELRLTGLLKRFVSVGLGAEHVARFFVCGGECNYLLRCALIHADGGSSTESPAVAKLQPVSPEVWQAAQLNGPRPASWPIEEVKQILDTAEASLRESVTDLRLRAKILRKERAVGLYPGGDDMTAHMPTGHGSKKLKREALDECVLRVGEALACAQPPIKLPYCVFNGGRDAWVDIGNKAVGVQALQAFCNIEPSKCLHVGDQFSPQTGNDWAARETCPCIWINSPAETGKVLQHLLHVKGLKSTGDDEFAFNTSISQPYMTSALGLERGVSIAVDSLGLTHIDGGVHTI